MAARAIGSGTIAFGMVSIPVKLYTATSSDDGIHFNHLHSTCGSRVKQQYFCPTDNVTVERDDLVKGYEFAKGKFVTFSAEELKALEETSTGAIDITEFVPLSDVDPVYFEKAYYLGPEKGAGRAYQLLAEAMRRTGLSAVANYAARGKQYLALLRPVEDGIVLQQLRHANEVRAMTDVPIDEAEVKDAELDLAIKLIDQVRSARFEPGKYKDDVRARIEDLVQKKIAGEEITAAPLETPRAQVIDLMSALKASIGLAPAPSSDAGGNTSEQARAADGAESKRRAPKAAKVKGGRDAPLKERG